LADANREALESLFSCGGISLLRGAIFDTTPAPLPASLGFERIEGMLLGLAIGDALGATTESMLPGERAARYGEIADYLPNRYAAGKAVGLPSDDTQLAFRTLEQMLHDGSLRPDPVARRFADERIFGIGGSVADFVRNTQDGVPWRDAGVHSAGNGAVMRIAPVILPYLRRPSSDLWVDTALCAMITHNDSASIASCVALVRIIWEILSMQSTPAAKWWVESFVETTRELELEKSYRPRGGAFRDYTGPLWRFAEEYVPAACEKGLNVREACNLWYSGAYLLETIPSVLYILITHGDDFEKGVIRAVNDTKDNDTIAAIVGAVLGALHGTDAIPKRWLDGLEGRMSDDDDGRIFELISDARARWWDGFEPSKSSASNSSDREHSLPLAGVEPDTHKLLRESR
jgi:ADP-ribosyl-[dinitrogen reductase] hydrolase